QDDGIRYAVETDSRNTQHTFGVSTFFLDSKGGVVLLYNSTINNHVVVNRAYASPETNGMTFVFDRSDVLEGTLPSDDYADPHTLVRANGDIWLIIMNQETGKRPQKDQVGTIHAYISHDDGVTFDYEGQLIAWSDWKKDEVRSLNDPKLVEFPEGTLRIYFAAWIPDETMEEGFRWDLLSAHN
ncbi:hypothetical protein HQ487_02035, partial [Candidatus Uhrbacteria bacterium]|nr:hypothetical protein [Candidatus Uhrbacteria bacterium]